MNHITMEFLMDGLQAPELELLGEGFCGFN